jgi:hypothetical protein
MNQNPYAPPTAIDPAPAAPMAPEDQPWFAVSPSKLFVMFVAPFLPAP